MARSQRPPLPKNCTWEQLREHYEKEILPTIEASRAKIVSDQRGSARAAVAQAESDALRLPESPGLGVELAYDLVQRFPYIEGSWAEQVER